MKWAYYNEHDPRAAAWIRELMKAGLIRRIVAAIRDQEAAKIAMLVDEIENMIDIAIEHDWYELRDKLQSVISAAAPEAEMVAEMQEDVQILSKECGESAARIAELEQSNALYKADAERIWAMMPELRNTDAYYEIHEAVQHKLLELEQKYSDVCMKWHDAVDARAELEREVAMLRDLVELFDDAYRHIYAESEAGRKTIKRIDDCLDATQSTAEQYEARVRYYERNECEKIARSHIYGELRIDAADDFDNAGDIGTCYSNSTAEDIANAIRAKGDETK